MCMAQCETTVRRRSRRHKLTDWWRSVTDDETDKSEEEAR